MGRPGIEAAVAPKRDMSYRQVWREYGGVPDKLLFCYFLSWMYV